MKKKVDNKGFSLVELIVVIAIMGVLVGILAPQFIRYVEQTRKSTDVKNGQEIATVLQAAVSDGFITSSTAGNAGTPTPEKLEVSSNIPGTPTKLADIIVKNKLIPEIPKAKSGEAGACFYATVNVDTGEVKVFFSEDGNTNTQAKFHEVFPKNTYTVTATP